MGQQGITAHLWDKLKKHLERKIADKVKAEDYLNSAYVKMREYQEDHTVANETAFLHRTACNLAIDDQRSARVRLAAPVCVSEFVELRDNNPLPDEVLIVRERLAYVRARLMQLPARTREIFLMHRLDGMKHREIGETLGISISAVEKHIAKAVFFISQSGDLPRG